MNFELRKYGKVLILNNYTIKIEKLSGCSILWYKEPGDKKIPCLSIFFDGNKLDFKNENEEMLKEAHNKITEIIAEVN